MKFFFFFSYISPPDSPGPDAGRHPQEAEHDDAPPAEGVRHAATRTGGETRYRFPLPRARQTCTV